MLFAKNQISQTQQMFFNSFLNTVFTKEKLISIYDIKAQDYKTDIVQNTGFIKSHGAKSHGPVMGDISILSVNMYTPNNQVSNLELMAQEITTLVDQHHPSFYTLQALNKLQLDSIKAALAPHYAVIGDMPTNTDLKTRKKEYRPLFYDTHDFQLLKDGTFVPAFHKDHAYASFGVFRSVKDTTKIFTVVNMDLYSADAKYIQEQLYNIIKNIDDGTYSQYPVFLAGMINEQTEAVSDLIKTTFKNTLDLDTNNEFSSKTTFHHTGDLNDNVQRDFILLKDEKKVFRVNLSRILTLFESRILHHYPIYTILSYNGPNNKKSEAAKNL